MSNTVLITSRSTVTNTREVVIPAFFKDRITDHYIGIVTPGRHISVHAGGIIKAICDYGWTPDLSEEKVEQIDVDRFFSVLNTCAHEIISNAGATIVTA